MSYVILIGDDNSLTATRKERIMQRSKLFDELWFLANPIYKGYDMSVCTLYMEYILPVSKQYKTEILTLSNERYEDHLKYTVSIDTELTSEPGDIELQLTFVYADMDENGKSIQRVRKISGTKISIIPIKAWSEIIPDSALSAIDQRIIMLNSQIKALEDAAEQITTGKADNLKYNSETYELQLLAGKSPIGNTVNIKSNGGSDPSVPDGDDVVEF